MQLQKLFMLAWHTTVQPTISTLVQWCNLVLARLPVKIWFFHSDFQTDDLSAIAYLRTCETKVVS